MMEITQKTCVIVGGGFAGLAAAKKLSKEERLRVIVVDKKNHHLFQPLLYQVATAGLSSADIAVPIRGEFTRAKNVEVHLSTVLEISLARQTICTERGEFPYDYLVLACGAQHSYFGKPEWEEHAPGLKTLEQAIEIRRRLLCAFEQAENENDAEKRAALMTFVIIGAGPTGVELAGALADLSHTVLVGDFKRINPSHTKIILLEGGKKVLSAFSAKLRDRAVKDLNELGVEVRLNAKVTNIDKDGVSIGEERILASTVLWAAGVQAANISKTLGVPLDTAGRVIVERDLSIPNFPNAFVAGDLSHVEEAPGILVPGLAAVALQQGELVSENILLDLDSRDRKAFHYKDKGMIATIGHKRAIFESGRIQFGGLAAWLAWLAVHLFFLISFKNRIAVLYLWTWSYLFSKRGSRLITSTDWKLDKTESLPAVNERKTG